MFNWPLRRDFYSDTSLPAAENRRRRGGRGVGGGAMARGGGEG